MIKSAENDDETPLITGTITITHSCINCKTEWQEEAMVVNGKQWFEGIPVICDECADLEATQADLERARIALEKFLDGIPEKYRESTREQIPAFFKSSAMPKTLNIGWVGPSRSGKSSAMAYVIKRMAKPFRWVSAPEMRQMAMDSAMATDYDSRYLMDRLSSIPVLAIDDISQAKFTESFTSTLYHVCETRDSKKLAILFTSQKPIRELREKIAEQSRDGDAADAICARLTENCHTFQAH